MVNKEVITDVYLRIVEVFDYLSVYAKTLDFTIKKLKEIDDNFLFNNYQYIEALKYCNSLFAYLNKINFILDLGSLNYDNK